MKRDMDIVRDLLFFVESKPPNAYFRYPEPHQADDPRLQERLAELGRLIDAELIRGNGTKGASGAYAYFTVWDLTQQGADLLDTIRNETVWAQTKEKVSSVGGSVAVDAIKVIATYYLNKLINLNG